MRWSDSAAFDAATTTGIDELLGAAHDPSDRWVIIWVAGRAVTSATSDDVASELSQFGRFLHLVSERLTSADAARGSFFFASSAGGVYAGSTAPPFTEHSVTSPLAPYGRFKVQAEDLLRTWSAREGVRAAVGRIANLYGPGQRLDKMQGLISHLALAQLTPRAASVYVSLDTLRDYIFVDDAADLLLDTIERQMSESERFVVKIIASGRAVTIADLLGYFRTISKGHPHVMLGTNAAASLQAVDLRLRSVIWPELDARQLTPLPVGIHRTLEGIRLGLQR